MKKNYSSVRGHLPLSFKKLLEKDVPERRHVIYTCGHDALTHYASNLRERLPTNEQEDFTMGFLHSTDPKDYLLKKLNEVCRPHPHFSPNYKSGLESSFD